MSTMTEIHHLCVTIAHHGDNEFYPLGRIMPQAGGSMLGWNGEPIVDVTHEVTPAALFEALPDTPCSRDDQGRATCSEFCVIIDACVDDGCSVETDKEVTVEVADALLDGTFAERLATARDALAEFYEHQEQRPEGKSSSEWWLELVTSKA